MSYEWVVPWESEESPTDPEAILDFLLEKREIKTREAKEEFLSPSPTIIFDPAMLESVSEKIGLAIKENRSIFIHGDYDVDGLCGTAILWETIYYDLNYPNVYPFIPHRIEHGYGLTEKSLLEIHKQSQAGATKLLITIDCGITAHQQVEQAKGLGFDVVILDHHVKPEVLPSAFLVLHSEAVCATSIAWMISQQLKGEIKHRLQDSVTPTLQCLPAIATLRRWQAGVGVTRGLDLVALATVADLQPLTGLNRWLVKLGLEELNHTERLGLQSLIEVASLTGKRLTTYDISWILAPRLNAMGRLEHALDSLRLLCTRNRNRAQELARRLNQVNRERQKMTEATMEQARAQAFSQPECSLLVLSHESWHEGIIGLIAAKITEEFRRPTITIAKGPKISKGSARSVEGINIIEIIRPCREFLLDLGGHAQAAGFSLATEKVIEFARRINLPVETFVQLRSSSSPNELKIDLVLPMSALTLELANTLEKLEPYGLGNPKPVFLTRDSTVADVKLVGSQSQHLKLFLTKPQSSFINHQLSTIGFNLGNLVSEIKIGNQVDIVYTIGEDDYDGQRRIQLKLKDLRKIKPA